MKTLRDFIQLDEISRKKLGQYVIDAAHDVGDKEFEGGLNHSSNSDGDYRSERKIAIRKQNITKAVNKLVNPQYSK